VILGASAAGGGVLLAILLVVLAVGVYLNDSTWSSVDSSEDTAVLREVSSRTHRQNFARAL
jgi:hypothetical protein